MASSSWIFYFVMLFAKNSLPFSLFQPRKSSIIKQGRMTIYISNSDLVEKYTINKTEIHHKLLEISNKQIRNFDQYKNSNVFAQHTVNAFNEARDFVDEFYSSNQIRRNTIKKVILDSGCGVGFSTLQLARKFPQYPVIGIDRSIHRLEKNIAYPIVQHDDTTPSSVKDNNLNSASQQNLDNVLLIRAELSDFWMLAAEQSNWIVESHYILYPNPYPKNKHVMRRWHAHPCFPALLVLGGRLVVRSNWAVYCEEMRKTILEMQRLKPMLVRAGLGTFLESGGCSASGFNMVDSDHTNSPAICGSSDDLFLGGEELLVEEETPGSSGAFDSPTTHFEMKYRRVGLPLYQLIVQLGLRNSEERNVLLSLLKS